MRERHFASDNSATVHPAIMEALAEANRGHAVAYGDDEWTRNAETVFRKLFGRKSQVFFVYNGTGANVAGLQAAVDSYHGIICSDVAHINVDECGAVEKYTGAKLLPVDTRDGRISPDQIAPLLGVTGVVHHSQPRVVSITQATEYGTVYPNETVREISRLCRKNNLYLHMDGARIANAAVALGTDIADITGDLGVDVLSLGGTKNGLMFGEAIVVWNPDVAAHLGFIRKQATQLASKMRYISAQFATLFGTELWRENATVANHLARELEKRLRSMPGVEIVQPVEANGLFVRLPKEVIPSIQEDVFFYPWDEAEGIVRFMVSYDSTSDDIDALVQAIGRHVN